jgi:hypothetical protein
MSEETPIISTPETTPEEGVSEDQQIAALLEQSKTDTPAETKPEEAPAEKAVEPSLEEQLAAIEKEAPAVEAAKEEKPSLSSEQQEILAAIPSKQVMETVSSLAQGYNRFVGAFRQGNFEGVLQEMQAFAPAEFDSFMEHLYQTRVVANEADPNNWVNKWIAHKEGRGNNPEVNALKQQLAAIQQQLQQRSHQEQQTLTQQQTAQIQQNYTNHIKGLFDQIKRPEGDRRWIQNEINLAVSRDPAAMQAVTRGDLKAINKHFAAAVREYDKRDMEVTTIKEGVLKEQEKHKMPLQGAGTQPIGALTDEMIAKLPREQRDSALDAKVEADIANLLGQTKGSRR